MGYHILNQLHKRSTKEQQQGSQLHVLPVYDFYLYNDTSFLLMAPVSHGLTLLDVLNLHIKQLDQAQVEENIVFLFTLHLLQQIHALHKISITHNDLELDNVMLIIDHNNSKKKRKQSNSKMKRKQSNGKLTIPKVCMIDFGASVDLLALPTKCTKVKVNWLPTCKKSDYPLLNKEHNPRHHDYWQLATMVHSLLYGDEMGYSLQKKKKRQLDEYDSGVGGSRYRINQNIYRCWHKDQWIRFFYIMLNPPEDTEKAVECLIQDFEEARYDVSDSSIAAFLDLFNTKE